MQVPPQAQQGLPAPPAPPAQGAAEEPRGSGRSKVPVPVLGAAAMAGLVAGWDALGAVAGMLLGGTGAVVGTLLRDALLLAAAGFAVRRAAWAWWGLLLLLGLTLLRAQRADHWADWLQPALALAAVALLLLPATRAWCNVGAPGRSGP